MLWKLENVSNTEYWDDILVQRDYFNTLSTDELFSINSYDDWYNLKHPDAVSNSRTGWIISHYYGSSLGKALSTLYPDYHWKPWLFGKQQRNNQSAIDYRVPHGFWSEEGNQREYLDWLAEELGVKTIEDWYRVRNEDVELRNGSGLLHYYESSLYKALSNIYPGIYRLFPCSTVISVTSF